MAQIGYGPDQGVPDWNDYIGAAYQGYKMYKKYSPYISSVVNKYKDWRRQKKLSRQMLTRSQTSTPKRPPPQASTNAPVKRRGSGVRLSSGTISKLRKKARVVKKQMRRKKRGSNRRVRFKDSVGGLTTSVWHDGSRRESLTAGKYHKNGCVMAYQASGVADDPVSISVQHGTGNRGIITSIYGAVYRHLLRKTGFEFKNWNEIAVDCFGTPVVGNNFNNAYYIRCTVRDPNGQAADFEVLLDGNTHMDNLIKVYNGVYNNLGQAAYFEKWDLIVKQVLENLHGGMVRSSVFMRNIELDIGFVSYLTMQNITQSGSNDDQNNFSILDVRQHPLEGKLYKTRKWANGFMYNDKSLLGNDMPLNTDPFTNGLQGFNALAYGARDTKLFNFKSPPQGWQLGAVSSELTSIRVFLTRIHFMF